MSKRLYVYQEKFHTGVNRVIVKTTSVEKKYLEHASRCHVN